MTRAIDGIVVGAGLEKDPPFLARPTQGVSRGDIQGASRRGTLDDTQRVSRRAAALELSVLIVLVEVVEWIVPLLPQPKLVYLGFWVLIATLLFLSFLRDRRTPRQLGLTFIGFTQVLLDLAIPLGVFVLLMLAIGVISGTLRLENKFLSMLAAVPLWALQQQYMLLAFSNHRLRLIVGQGKKSVLATAALFGLLHLPNPTLASVCAVGGFIWAGEYERKPNLFAIALTHAVASAFLANSLPHSLLKNMVVGYNYFFK